MFPVLDVYLDGATVPVQVQTTSLMMWTYEDLTGKPIGKSSEHGLRLTLAYIGVTDLEPPTLADVKAWAKEHAVSVTIGDDITPTKPAHTAG